MLKGKKLSVLADQSLGLGEGPLASLLRTIRPLLSPSPKKITSTVRSSLDWFLVSVSVITCSGVVEHKPVPSRIWADQTQKCTNQISIPST